LFRHTDNALFKLLIRTKDRTTKDKIIPIEKNFIGYLCHGASRFLKLRKMVKKGTLLLNYSRTMEDRCMFEDIISSEEMLGSAMRFIYNINNGEHIIKMALNTTIYYYNFSPNLAGFQN
jgi:hypothetical protein